MITNHPTYQAEEIALARAARTYIHQHTCPEPYRSTGDSCSACPTGRGLLDAIRVLNARPRDARAARVALHDAVCASGCPPENTEHADKTQARKVAALRRFLAEVR